MTDTKATTYCRADRIRLTGMIGERLTCEANLHMALTRRR